MSTQIELFNTPAAAPVPAGNVRQKQIDAVLERAHAEWKERFEAFVIEYAALADEPFTSEDVWTAYDAKPGLPRTHKKQASGGIFQRLVRERRLHPAGMHRSRKFGNLLQAYRRW